MSGCRGNPLWLPFCSEAVIGFLLLPITFFSFTYSQEAGAGARPYWARHVVISEISPREGYIELYNPTEVTQKLEGYEIQTMTPHEKFWRTRVKFGKGGSLVPFGYFLVANLRASLSVKADIAEPFSFGLLPEEGSLRLLDASGRQVDLVGWGKGSFSEGSPAPRADVLERLPSLYSPQGGNGQDTDDNGRDFLTRGSGEPQSSASAPEPPTWAKAPAPPRGKASLEASMKFKAEGLTDRALLDWREGRFFSAYEKLERAAALDPKNAAEKLRSFEADLRKALAVGEISRKHEPMARSCLFYLRGDYPPALSALSGIETASSHKAVQEEAQRALARIRSATPVVRKTKPILYLTDKLVTKPTRTLRSEVRPRPLSARPQEIQIVRQDSQGAERLYFEGLSFYAKGMRPQAVEIWRKAARLDPEDARPRKALKRVSP